MGRKSRNKEQKCAKQDNIVDDKEKEKAEKHADAEYIVKKEKEIEKEIPTNEILRSHIRRLIPLVNLQNTGVKAFTKLLAKECCVGGADLSSRSKFIKEALTEAINEMDDSDDDDDSDDKKKKKQKTNKSHDKKAKKKKKPPPPQSQEKKKRITGLSVKKEITSELSSFLGKDPSELVARTEIVKCMWEYIKENELQNPDNKREIYLDRKMKDLFRVDMFTMFTMNKYIGAHIHPYKPVDLTTPSEATIKKKKKAAAAAAAADDNDNGNKKKRKKTGMQPPYRLSIELSEVVGTDILPRPQVVKGIWIYIKKHNLQDPTDKRNILCDDKLKAVMGGNDKVTMFTMNTFVTDHLVEKLDKSEYNHDEDNQNN